jgi:hypothetical protein
MTEFYYPASYHDARSEFRKTALQINARLEKHVVIKNFDGNGDLTIDIAIIGPPEPVWSLVISSGLHGVEGFFGSAVQTAYMRNLVVADLFKARGQLLLIHAINPFGFAALRRVNEDNVDLNRNYLLPEERYEGASDAYARLNNFLNPAKPPRLFDWYLVEVLWRLYRQGLPAFKQAVAEGQYEYPKGIFFGGHKPARSTEILQQNIMRWIQGRHVVHLDFHTGLGKYGSCKLLVPAGCSPQQFRCYSTIFGSCDVEIAGSGSGIAYKTRGDFGRYITSVAKDINYHFFFAEFATYSEVRILGVLRRENQTHFFSPAGSKSRQRAKTKLAECFCPTSLAWRTAAARRGLEIIQSGQQMTSLLASGGA